MGETVDGLWKRLLAISFRRREAHIIEVNYQLNQVFFGKLQKSFHKSVLVKEVVEFYGKCLVQLIEPLQVHACLGALIPGRRWGEHTVERGSTYVDGRHE